MKKFVYSLCAVALAVLSGCQDELGDRPGTPAQTGDEISFGSSLENTQDAQTRTVYKPGVDSDSDGEIDYYPVEWEPDGSDQIAIYCPQAANGNLVTYRVTPDENNPSTSSAVVKVNEDQAGLQWGTADTHAFSAIYPADKITGIQNGKMIGTIPVEQDPVSWEKDTDPETGGTIYTGVANTDYAYMWAYNTHNKSDSDTDVALQFKPWITILDVEINGPSGQEEAIKMSSVQIVSTSGETLNGEFEIDFTPVEQGTGQAPIFKQSGNAASERSTISIELYDHQEGDFITLRHGDKIVVRFYLLPKDEGFDTSTGRQDLQVRVTPFNMAVLTRTLNAVEGTQTGGILPHKVNRVILPSVTNLGPNYWMSSLNPNIYVTELSLPGSKMSYQSETNVSGRNAVIYQDLSIEDQFRNGIRAFQFQTHGVNDGGNGVARDPNMRLALSVGGEPISTRLSEAISDIAAGLDEAIDTYHRTQEYAVVILSYSAKGSDDYGFINRTPAAEAWMEAVRNELNDWVTDGSYRIYTERITPSTTIQDVAGHIIFKINYNNNDMANHLGISEQIPAMFALWGDSGDDENQAYATNDLRWGTSNHTTSADMTWFYQEVTTIGYNDNGGEATATQKRTWIEDMWEQSIDNYHNNQDHSMWFMNDLGGSYVNGGYDSSESNTGVEAWTEFVGPYATGLLQGRTEDATLGIVLLNYANPQNQYTGNLIQTIINNNFNFQLRTDGANQSETYNATYQNGGNAIGWE